MLVNKRNFQWVRTPGDHAILKWEHPDGPGVESRTVSIPLSEPIATAHYIPEPQEGVEPFLTMPGEGSEPSISACPRSEAKASRETPEQCRVS